MGDTPAIHFERVSKTFGRGARQVHAVKDLTLSIAPGQVYGFLGHNGAGKTTSIRMILDLIRPTTGRVLLFGQPVRERRAALRRVGALVEGATFYGFLSAWRNLEVLAHTSGIADRARINALLEQVGLAARAEEAVKGFSTGMKQRLGLAAVLLTDPDLVILDEPTNGLDPEGIREMRSFVRDLAAQDGKTVFLSSHLLNEVEQICDRVAIIRRGEMIREGAVHDLLASHSQLRVEAAPLDRASEVLCQRWAISQDNGSLLVNAGRAESPEVVRMLVAHEIDVFEVAERRQSLEDFFLSVAQ